MTSIGAWNGLPFQTTSNNIANPPGIASVISHTFSAAGNSSDMLSSKDKITISDESAKFVSSSNSVHAVACAALPLSDTHYTSSTTMTLSLWFKSTDTNVFCLAGWNYLTSGFYLSLSSGKVKGNIRTAANGVRPVLSSAATYADGNWHFACLTYDNTTLTLYIDGTTATTTATGVQLNDQARFCVGGYSDSATSISLKYGANNMSALNVVFWDNKCLSSDEVTQLKTYPNQVGMIGSAKYWFPMQSQYSVTGGYILDIASGANSAATTFSGSQDYLHYNLVFGFDKYVDNATGLLYIYVPYTGGSPVATSISGYTKVSSHPAGKWHNGAETKIVVGWSGAAKDANGWPACSDSRFVTGAFKTQDGTIVTRANADPNEIFIRVTCAPVGYCKEVYPPTMPEVSLGDYVVLDISGIKCQNLIWYASNAEPTLDASVKLHKYINKTDFVTDDSTGELVYDHEDHIVTDF